MRLTINKQLKKLLNRDAREILCYFCSEDEEIIPTVLRGSNAREAHEQIYVILCKVERSIEKLLKSSDFQSEDDLKIIGLLNELLEDLPKKIK
jgi:hypothetical protein